MKQEEIKNKLVVWFDKMLTKYEWLSIKFEYSNKLRNYLVSFSPSSKIQVSDEFCEESMSFEDEMNRLYGDDAPLFCDDEKYFKLSDEAEIVLRNIVFNRKNIHELSFDNTYNNTYIYQFGNDFQLAA